MRTVALLSLLFAGVSSSGAAAQSFSYADFSNPTGLALNGSAAISGAALRLTSNAPAQKAAVWRVQPVEVDLGFDTSVAFRVSSLIGGGADGIVFLIQNDPRGMAAIGDSSGDLGYGAEPASPAGTAIANSLAVEIDTFDGFAPWNDPNGNHLSVHTNGTGENSALESRSLAALPLATNISDGAVHTLRVKYVPGTLEVSFDGSLALTIPYAFASGGTWASGSPVGGLSLIGGIQAYVGFSAATSGSSELHDVLSWSWSSIEPTPAHYCTAGTSSSGCVAQITALQNPSVSFANPCTLQVGQIDGQRSAMVFYGLTSSIQPWAGGSTSFLCVKPPTQRLGAQSTGGTLGLCDGSLNVDWNAFQLGHPTALGAPWSAGATAHCQAWYRDPPAAKATNLSAAITFTYLP